jgi:hypothetical protein
MHYEVELRELLYEADGTGGLRVTGSMWKPVRVFNKDTVPMVLTFEALSAAQAYVGRNQPGAVRIVRVTEDGEREAAEAGSEEQVGIPPTAVPSSRHRLEQELHAARIERGERSS